MMYYSSDDMLALIAEINTRRMVMVLGKRQKRQGGMWLYTPQQHQWMLSARKLHHRYLAGNYRHSEAEEVAVANLVHWLVEEHALNENTGKSHVQVNRSNLRIKKPLPQVFIRRSQNGAERAQVHRYGRYIKAIVGGEFD